MDDRHQRIGFGGGCHWCTEAVFQSLNGVVSVEQGFIAARPPDDRFSEAVIVRFEAAVIPLPVLIEVHLLTHASKSDHMLRGKYRSAVYVFDEPQFSAATDALQVLKAGGQSGSVTRVLRFDRFQPSAEHFHSYYATDPDRPFCRTYISPKLSLLRRQFAAHVR